MTLLAKLSPEDRHLVEQGGTPHDRLRQQLAEQHPIHDEFAKAYSNLGGVTGLTNWAKDNQSEFYKILPKLAPAPQHVKHSGGIELRLSLKPSPLDE